MKYLFYIIVALLVYRAFFQPKVVIERHYEPKKKPKPTKQTGKEYAEYEEIE